MPENARRPFDRLVLKNVRCFRDTTIDLDPRLTVLLGENGSGKTTVVEALASLSFGDDEGLQEFPLARKAGNGEIALYQEGEKKPVARWTAGARGTKEHRRLPEDRCFLAYGRYRRVFFPEEPTGVTLPIVDLEALAGRANHGRTVTLFQPDNHLLRNLSRYLAALHSARELDPRIDSVWKCLDASLSELGHGISGVAMEAGRTGYIPKVVRNGEPWDLRELSDGYQAILVIVFDLILRYTYLFPKLRDPLQGAATVAVDEVDLHLHPRWQRTVARQLTTLFPNTQFILTTHSPAVVQGAIDRKRGVVTLQEKRGIAVARTLTQSEMDGLDGAEIGSVLQESELFRIDSRYSPEYAEVEKRIDQVQKKVEKGTADDEDRRELFEALATLQRLVVADEERRADGSFLSQMTALQLSFLRDLADEIEERE